VVYRRVDGAAHYLLIRDPYDNWGLPKGHVERGETSEQTAVREVREETGIE
jgi:8-oxo-dGTP pyrophosphatase MutT (NUDIX family)